MEDLLQKYLFYHAPKDLTWIFYTQIHNIFQTTPGVDPTELEASLLFVHAFYLNNQDMVAVFQTKDLKYHLLANRNQMSDQSDEQKQTRVQSKMTSYPTLEKLWSKLTKSQRSMLNMPKFSVLKLKEVKKLLDPPVLKLLTTEKNEWVPTVNDEGLLDANYNPFVTSEVLLNLTSLETPTSLTLTNCVNITDFKWCHADWAQKLKNLTLVKMYPNSKITAYHLKFLVDHLPSLERISFHYCGTINLTALLGLLGSSKCQLKSIVFDNSAMLCQGNGYSGVISEEQWLELKNDTLESLYLNSSNVSLDIINYLRQSCTKLNNVMLCHKVYENLKQNMSPPDDPPSAQEITYFDLEGKTKMVVPSNYELRNLLKDKYQAPFSSSMLSRIEKIMGSEAIAELKPKPKPKPEV